MNFRVFLVVNFQKIAERTDLVLGTVVVITVEADKLLHHKLLRTFDDFDDFSKNHLGLYPIPYRL